MFGLRGLQEMMAQCEPSELSSARQGVARVPKQLLK